MSEMQKFEQDRWVINRSTGTPGMVLNSYPDATKTPGEPMRWLYSVAFEATATKSTHAEANIPEEKLDYWTAPKFPVDALVETKISAAAVRSGTVKLRSTTHAFGDTRRRYFKGWMYLVQYDGEGAGEGWLFENEITLQWKDAGVTEVKSGETQTFHIAPFKAAEDVERPWIVKYERACRKLNQARTELKAVRDTKDRLHARIAELETQNVEKQKANQDLRDKLDRSRELHTKALQGNDSLRIRVAELEKQNVTLQEEDVRTYQAAIDRLMAHIAKHEILGDKDFRIPTSEVRDMIGRDLLRLAGQRIFERTMDNHG